MAMTGSKRKDRIRGYGGDDYETMGTKKKDRIRGYGVNDSKMYPSWYISDPDKRRRRYDESIGKYDELIGKYSIGGGGGTGGSRYSGLKQNSDGSSHSQGGKDDDYLQGGKGDDKLRGGKGDDDLLGGRGHDHLRGGKGDDYLIGGEGNDYLKGGKGDDILIGGAGQDKLKGGKGADIFDVKSDTEKGSKCIIKDFNPDEGDKISAADNVSIEMKENEAIIETDGATIICKFDSDYRPENVKTLDDWFTDSTIVDLVEG